MRLTFPIAINFFASIAGLQAGSRSKFAMYSETPASATCPNANTKLADSNSKGECALICTLDDTCESFSFINNQCVLSDRPACSASIAANVFKKIVQIDVSSTPGYEQWIGDRRFWVFQQRKTGAVSFARKWTEYERGFGDSDDFWSGLIFLSRMSAQYGNLTMRAEMLDWKDQLFVGEFSGFSVQDARTNYTMRYKQFLWDSSNVSGDSFDWAIGMQFSTYDADHDRNGGSCSTYYHGNAGWWFNTCSDSNPNGMMTSQEIINAAWSIWYGYVHWNKNSLKGFKMMIEF